MKKSVAEFSELKPLVFAGKNNILLLRILRQFNYSFFLLALFACLQGAAQDIRPEAKIDPAFKIILAAKKRGKDTLANLSLSSRFKIEPTEGRVAGSRIPVKRYNCIVYTKDAQALRDSGVVVNTVLPNFVTAWATLDQIAQMAGMPQVSYIKAPATIGLHNDVALGNTGAALLHAGKLNNTVYKGKNVLVAIFDTGIDWDHPDFRNPGDQTKSRILRIWDQTIAPVPGEVSPAGFNYGVEYTQAQINDELDGTPSNYVREKDIYGHGTHVAGTAAGNGSALASKKYTGMAPEADLIIIKGGDSTFASNRIIDALSYLQGLATSLGKPVVLNMSLGSILTAHDGTDPEEVAIDNFTNSAPGRAVVASAGNDNFNLHNRLNLAGNSGTPISFTVQAFRPTTTTVISYIMYANGANDLSAALTVPGSGDVITAGAEHDTSVNVLNNNFNVTMFNRVDPGNNNRFIYFSVTRNGSNTASPLGTWSLSVQNNTASPLTLDGWMVKAADTVFDKIYLAGGDNNYTVNTPANAASAVAVGSYSSNLSWFSSSGVGAAPAERQDNISSTSSIGPRRDGLLKPDITATGNALVSCLSSDAIPSPTPYITNAGLYQAMSGTSMSAPVITGSIALLFQANPAASAGQVRNLLLSNTDKDALTELPGATPNTTWGAGKVNVFKAASALFGCTPADMKIYKYDSSNLLPVQHSATMQAAQKVAVRFTPNTNGKLGGAFFYTLNTSRFTTQPSLVLEVRTNNAGNPGTLLGTLTLDSVSIRKNSMNYVDLNSLNISVTAATDYFITLTRIAGSSASWFLLNENVFRDNRSLNSVDGGVNWSVASVDYVIRSVVYANGQSLGTLAAASSADTRDLNTSNSFINSSCALIAQLVPGGASPVAGVITSRVWLETGVPHYGPDPFVSRHYQITPAANASGATGRLTLYYTQQEFTAFNNDPYSLFDLPSNPNDAAGKANLRVGKYPGSSSDGSGLPASYSEPPVIIDPDDAGIVWNEEYSRWEISFDVNGFSGFVLQTKATALPVSIEYFKGKKAGAGNQLSWKINCSNTSMLFEVERSRDGLDFDSIGSLLTASANCAQPFSFTDVSPVPGADYYRIRITENNGMVRYTGVVLLKADGIISTLYPTILTGNTAVQVNYTGVKGNLFITDATGKQLYSHVLTTGVQSVTLPLHGSGIYFYSIKNDDGKISGGKIVVR